MLMEGDDQKLLMASDAGYGFVCTAFNDLLPVTVPVSVDYTAGKCARHAAAGD